MLNSKAICLFVGLWCVFGAPVFGQSNAKPKIADKTLADTSAVRSSPAYAELLLKKTDLQSELESILLDYTEDFPKVRETRHALELLEKESARVLAVKPSETGKLTLALGKLIVKKVELETDLWSILRTYKEEHPDAKRAKRKVEIYEAAIKEILG